MLSRHAIPVGRILGIPIDLDPSWLVKRVQPDTDLEAALDEMDRDGVNQLPVMEDGRLLGMLRRGDLVGFLPRLRSGSGRPWSAAV